MTETGTTAPRPYYEAGGLSAAHYDLMTGGDADIAGDVEIYAAITPAGGTVLELGSGTGRLSADLASRGFRVTGVELAPVMLARAEQKRKHLPKSTRDRLSYLAGDLVHVDLQQSFDAVIAPYFVLAHIPPSVWPDALQNAAKHLKPGARLAVHMPLGEMMRRPTPPAGALVGRRPLPGGELSLYLHSQIFADGRLDVSVHYVERRSGREVQSTETLTLYDGDLSAAAHQAGLCEAGEPVLLGRSGRIHFFSTGS